MIHLGKMAGEVKTSFHWKRNNIFPELRLIVPEKLPEYICIKNILENWAAIIKSIMSSAPLFPVDSP